VSEPPGASVKENGEEICAATPCDHVFPADPTGDHAERVEHKAVFTRAGYKPETRPFHGSDGQVSVTLAPQVAVKAWQPPPQQPKAKAPDTAAPQGFKDIPY
jgi:hypothetical protein